MFNNQIFESWLDKKSDEILSKVDREKISTEEMIVLILKAQTNHFFHIDQEVKEQINTVNFRIDLLDKRIDGLDKRIDGLDKRIDSLDHRVERLDHKIDNRFMWTIG
ncbi:MAG: hypothetical protein EHM20_04060, partial [Alphaproteobacteria bacterium]